MKNPVVTWANNWGRKMGIYGIATEKIEAGQYDDLDAFRHAFCHAYLIAWGSFTQDSKDASDIIGTLMEDPEVFGTSAAPCAKEMDLHNNLVGQRLAPSAKEMWSVLRYGEDSTHFIAQRVANAVKAGETINDLDDPRMPLNCRKQSKVPTGTYIWRTAGDKNVRFDHAVREGKVFQQKIHPREGTRVQTLIVAARLSL